MLELANLLELLLYDSRRFLSVVGTLALQFNNLPCLLLYLLLLLHVNKLTQLLTDTLEGKVSFKVQVTQQPLDDQIPIKDRLQPPRQVFWREHPLQCALSLHVEHPNLLLEHWAKVALNVLAGILPLEVRKISIVVGLHVRGERAEVLLEGD